MGLFKKQIPDDLKNIYFDTETVFEMNNPAAVFQALVARHGMTRNLRKFTEQLTEYLVERGAKILKGPKGMVFYKEDEHLYNNYVEFCKSEGSEEPYEKDAFFERYATLMYCEIFENKK
jgi:hypothetical protein